MSILLENTLNFVALLNSVHPHVSTTTLNRLIKISKAMISMTGRVTILGISRWGGKGGAYRTVQRGRI